MRPNPVWGRDRERTRYPPAALLNQLTVEVLVYALSITCMLSQYVHYQIFIYSSILGPLQWMRFRIPVKVSQILYKLPEYPQDIFVQAHYARVAEQEVKILQRLRQPE